MKKTLIALMALAGVACAADFSVPTGGNFFGGDFVFSFTVTEDQLTSTNTNDVLAYYAGNATGTNYNVNAFVLKYATGENVGAITLSVGDGHFNGTLGSGNAIIDTTTFTSQRGADFNTTLAVGETYTIINVGANEKQTVSLYSGSLVYDYNGWYQWTEADGQAVKQAAVALETVSYNGNMNGGDANTVMTTGANVAYNVQMLPEPATATLSLLALAGLAARRRRK